VLLARLRAVYEFFAELFDPSAPDQRPFFVGHHANVFKNSMHYVSQGLLSDPPGMDMYLQVKVLSTGLIVYRSLRSTSPLEGYHLHLRQVCHHVLGAACERT
jgi:hypothetical protein